MLNETKYYQAIEQQNIESAFILSHGNFLTQVKHNLIKKDY